MASRGSVGAASPATLAVVAAVLVAYAVAAMFKTQLGADERLYLLYGSEFVSDFTYSSPRHHPLYGILVALAVRLVGDPLVAARMVYVTAGTLISLPVYYFASRIIPPSSRNLAVLMVGIMPGTLVLPLYSGTHPLFVALAYGALACLHGALERRRLTLGLCAGSLLGLSYMARMDGLVYFALIACGLLILAAWRRDAWVLALLLVVAGSVGVVAAPWHIWLYGQGHFISTVAWGGWVSGAFDVGVMKLLLTDDAGNIAADGSNLNLMGVIENPSLALLVTAKNLRAYVENLGSLRLLPIFVWPLVGLGLIGATLNGRSLVLLVPIVAASAYLAYGAIDHGANARYLVPIVPVVSLFAAAGLAQLVKLAPALARFRPVPVAFSLLIVCDAFYLAYGHSTYNPGGKIETHMSALDAGSRPVPEVMPGIRVSVWPAGQTAARG